MKFPEQCLDLSSFGKGKKILSPYTSWLTVRVLVQLERITFRAVLIFLRTALLVCSESDTFLKNYIIFRSICNYFSHYFPASVQNGAACFHPQKHPARFFLSFAISQPSQPLLPLASAVFPVCLREFHPAAVQLLLFSRDIPDPF